MDSLLFLSSSEDVQAALSSGSLWTAIAEILILIALGFFLRKKNVFSKSAGQVLTKVVLSAALPCLAFSSFMTPFTLQRGQEALVNFFLGFFFYLLFIALSKIIFFWEKDKEKRKILGVLFAFGTTTFFSQPILSAVYGDVIYNDSNLQNIAYRCFLYSYAYFTISGLSFKTAGPKTIAKKIFLNPILLATLLGLLLWALQGLPGAAASQWWTLRTDWLNPVKDATPSYVPLWRFDVSLPWIHQVVKILASLTSPLVYLAIGAALGEGKLSSSFLSKDAWLYSFLKAFIEPAIVLLFIFLIEFFAKMAGHPGLINENTMICSLILFLAPPAAMAVAYCLSFNKEAVLASDCSLLGTLVSIVALLFWTFMICLLKTTGFFLKSA